MAETLNLGRVGFVPKGTYSASTAYSKYDVVNYNGGTYVVIADTVTGVTPGTDATKYKVLVDNAAAVAANTAAAAANAAAASVSGEVAGIQRAFDRIGGAVLDVDLVDHASIVDSKALLHDGSETTATVTCLTGYIPVVAGYTYTVNQSLSSSTYCNGFYAADKTFISAEYSRGTSPLTLVAPENAAYLRVTGLKASKDALEVCCVLTAGGAKLYAMDETLTVAGKVPDSKIVGDEIADLKNAINGWSGGTRDVTSEVEWSSTAGGVNYQNGTIVSSLTTYSNADIPLNGATHVEGHTRAGLEPEKAMGFFDSNGIWIPGSYNQGGSSYSWDYSLDVPEGAVTLRLCCATSYINTFTCILTLPGTAGLIDRVEALEENPGITDYTDLTNKPSINSVTLSGNKSLDDLGIASKDDVDSLEIEINGGESPIDTEIAIADFLQDNFRIMSSGYWATQNNGAYYMQLPEGVISVSIKANASYKTKFAFLSAYSPVNGQKAPVVGNSGNPFEVNAGETEKQDVPETATFIWISRQDSDGYNTTPQKIIFTAIGTTVGFAEKLNEIEYGNSVTYTGSNYQIREGDFKQGSCWRLLMSETTASVDYVEISALTDKDDTSTSETQFLLYKGKEVLWSPLKNYEAIRYGVNGSCTITINDCTSIFDEIEHRVFYCGPNREYTKLIDAIAAAEQYMGSILYVDAGEYDLVQEFGDDYFSGISAGGMHGVSLKNRIHIVFSPNSYVTCHYTGSNAYVLEDFSPFNCGQYGFTIENLNLSSSRVRYAIHDERNGKTELCLSRYINCKITHDNTDNEEWHSYSCIGGGLGSNHEVVIENCVFESIVESGTAVHGCVSYHPSNDSSNHDFACKLTVKDNFFVTGTLELSGSRTDASIDTVVIFTNNSVEYNSANAANGIYFSGSSGYAGTHYDIRAWNNDIRQ